MPTPLKRLIRLAIVIGVTLMVLNLTHGWPYGIAMIVGGVTIIAFWIVLGAAFELGFLEPRKRPWWRS